MAIRHSASSSVYSGSSQNEIKDLKQMLRVRCITHTMSERSEVVHVCMLYPAVMSILTDGCVCVCVCVRMYVCL